MVDQYAATATSISTLCMLPAQPKPRLVCMPRLEVRSCIVCIYDSVMVITYRALGMQKGDSVIIRLRYLSSLTEFG